MKKTKYFLVSVMAVMLCFMCLMTTTFSWFTRPSESGGILEWLNSDLGLSYDTVDGKNISMVTYELSEDGKSATQNSVTDFSNSNGIAQDHRKYYRTDITNSGNADQSVSLYIESLKVNQGEFYLGVNNPLKTYKKCVATTANTSAYANSGTMRVYFQPDKARANGWEDIEYQVWYSLSNTAPSNKVLMTKIGYDNTGQSDTYYADIPDNAVLISFHKKDLSDGDNQTKNITVSDTDLSKTASKVFCLDGGVDQENWGNIKYKVYSVNGANIVRYYETITIPLNGTFDAKLEEGNDYIGKEITYSSSNTNIFYCDSSENSVIHGKSVGSATLTTTVKGSTYNDTFVKTTIVNVVDGSEIGDVPIVTNYKVPAKKDGKDTTVSVYWYINNEGSETLKYTIDDVYLSL